VEAAVEIVAETAEAIAVVEAVLTHAVDALMHKENAENLQQVNLTINLEQELHIEIKI